MPKEEIEENGYDLSINRYKETEHQEVEYESPKVILQKLRSLEDEIRADLDALEKLLNLKRFFGNGTIVNSCFGLRFSDDESFRD